MSEERCKKGVHSDGMSFARQKQCSRRAVRDGFCSQHHPEAEAKRNAESRERWQMESRQRQAGYDRQNRAYAALSALEALTDAERAALPDSIRGLLK